MNTKSWLNLQTKIANPKFAEAATASLNATTKRNSSTYSTIERTVRAYNAMSGQWEWVALCAELGLDEAHLVAPQHEQKPFNCPHCGGNQTERRNGKTVCAYCLTEIR